MSALPIDGALLPADVRAGGARARELYTAALGFERMLTQELGKSLAAAFEGDGEDGSGGQGMYAQMLPDALADGLAAGGGLGLAPALYHSLKDGS
jgi:Rod binding domain-containing protein